MTHQYIHVIVPKSMVDDVIKVAEIDGVTLAGVTAVKGPTRTVHFLAQLNTQQTFVDELQRALFREDGWQIVISPVDAVVTRSPEQGRDDYENTETREELLSQVSRVASITPTYITLVTISAIVAALGMIENNVAAIIGAMVIAPLLGPLLGSILGISLGERDLITKSLNAGAAGIALAIVVGAFLGIALRFDVTTTELAARASVGYDDIALALAAGAAAALSLTAGAEAALVGVMVAVALMPPAAAIGLFLGKAAWVMAGRAAMMLAVNLAALHLSGQVVFLVRGVRPRTRYRRAKVKQSIRLSVTVSTILLIILAALIGLQIRQ